MTVGAGDSDIAVDISATTPSVSVMVSWKDSTLLYSSVVAVRVVKFKLTFRVICPP